MKAHVVAFIFARGGSKGVPRKNIRMVAGKPLIAYAIETARAVPLIDRVVVSTDDAEVAEVARRWGAEVPFLRPPELARDDSPEWLAWQHAIRAVEGEPSGRKLDVFVSVPATAPLRTPQDVAACISTLLEGDADVVISVTPARRHPRFNMVTLEAGYARLLDPAPGGAPYRRQDAPPVFDMTTAAYAARPDYVLAARSIFEGRVKAVVLPQERALDIDTELDLRLAELLLRDAGGV